MGPLHRNADPPGPQATATGMAGRRLLVANFARRDLKSRYKGSVLGWLWSLLSPLATLVVYSLVFSVFLKVVPPIAANGKANFALYLFSGLVPWLLFMGMVTGSMDWLASVGDLRRKVFFPPEAAVFGSALALGVQSAIEAAVLVAGITIFGALSPTILLFPLVLLCTGLLGLGIGFFVVVANTHYRDVRYLVGIVLNALFFLVPIVYTPDLVPERAWGLPVSRMMEFNPLYQLVAAAREVVYLGQWPGVGRWAAVVGAPLAIFLAGWGYFARRSMDLSEEM